MKALFVLRHHNDFDSMASVVDGWVRLSDQHRAMVYVSSPELNWRGDYRTDMLLETGQVTFTDMWAVAGLGNGGALAHRWQENKPDMRLSRRILQLATELRVLPGFSAKMNKLLDEFSPDIIAFDWYRVPKRRKIFSFFGYQEILHWKYLHNRPLISLPHGLLLYSHGSKRIAMPDHYDRIFVESQRKKSYFQGEELDKVIVSGSPRYDPYWVDRISQRLASETGKGIEADDATRIVFFATKAASYFDSPLLLSWLAHLASHDHVHLVVQPHPRGQRASAFASIAGFANVYIDARTPASTLIGTADMVSTLVSSVMVEAVVREREILYPKFVTTAQTQFDEVGACIALSDMAETHTAINAFRAGKRVPRARYDAFLQEFVYGGGDPNTIERICLHMQNLAAAGV